MTDSHLRIRIIKDFFFTAIITVLSFMLLAPLLLILFYIIKNGAQVISLDFLINIPKPIGETGGGILNAFIGTVILIFLSSVFAIPLGILSGIFLSENRQSNLAEIVRFVVDVLQGVPSIVIGIVAYTWIVVPARGFSALSGGIALAIMMLPVIVRSTEETLKLIPHSMKEASIALGVPYYRTMLKVILPAGMSGILSAVFLSIARIAGETAPLLFTAFGNPFVNTNIMKPISSLPVMIYNYAMSPYPEWHAIAWGASLVLVSFVLVLNILAKVVTSKWKIQY